jgi:hypothetical protein
MSSHCLHIGAAGDRVGWRLMDLCLYKVLRNQSFVFISVIKSQDGQTHAARSEEGTLFHQRPKNVLANEPSLDRLEPSGVRRRPSPWRELISYQILPIQIITQRAVLEMFCR